MSSDVIGSQHCKGGEEIFKHIFQNSHNILSLIV